MFNAGKISVFFLKTQKYPCIFYVSLSAYPSLRSSSTLFLFREHAPRAISTLFAVCIHIEASCFCGKLKGLYQCLINHVCVYEGNKININPDETVTRTSYTAQAVATALKVLAVYPLLAY